MGKGESTTIVVGTHWLSSLTFNSTQTIFLILFRVLTIFMEEKKNTLRSCYLQPQFVIVQPKTYISLFSKQLRIA